MIASVGPSSAEGSLLKGTSDDPSSGSLPLTPEKRLQILKKWQDQETAYTEEIREFILKSRFSRNKQRKVSSIGPANTEGSLLKGTSGDPSSGSLPLTPEKRLQILQKWQDQETAYTEEIREFILKSRFSRDKQRKVSSVSRSSTEDTDSALVQQQDTESALVKQQDTDSALVQQQDTDSALVQQQDTDSALVQQQDTDSALVQQQEQASSQSACQPVVTSLSDQTPFSSFDVYLSKDQWCRCNVCDKCILSKNKQSHLESTLHLTNVAAMKDDSDDVDLIKSKRSPDDKASDAVEITKFGTIPAETILSYSDDVDFIKSKRIPDDEASDAVEITKFETVPADTILGQMLIQARRKSREYNPRFPNESDFTELGNVNRHVFQISHRNKVLGTAFFFSSFDEGQQYLLTAGHVIAGYDEETVLETEGCLCFPASPVGISSIKDVGVLRFKFPLFPRMYPFLRPILIDLGTETSTHIYVVGCMSGALSEKCLVLPSQDKDDGFIRFQSKLFSEDSFGSPCLVFKDGQYLVKGMLIGREKGTDTPYELIAITFRCVLNRLGFP